MEKVLWAKWIKLSYKVSFKRFLIVYNLKVEAIEILVLLILIINHNCFYLNYFFLKGSVWFINGSAIFCNCHTILQSRIYFEFRFKCNGCEAFIVETCFKCTVCSDFYLCLCCYMSSHYPNRCVVFDL